MNNLWAGIAVGLVLALAFGAAGALAHTGKLAKDECHYDRTLAERHWHLPNSETRGGRCLLRIKQVDAESMIAVMAAVDKILKRLDTAGQPAAAAQHPADRICIQAVRDSNWLPHIQAVCTEAINRLSGP